MFFCFEFLLAILLCIAFERLCFTGFTEIGIDAHAWVTKANVELIAERTAVLE